LEAPHGAESREYFRSTNVFDEPVGAISNHWEEIRHKTSSISGYLLLARKTSTESFIEGEVLALRNQGRAQDQIYLRQKLTIRYSGNINRLYVNQQSFDVGRDSRLFTVTYEGTEWVALDINSYETINYSGSRSGEADQFRIIDDSNVTNVTTLNNDGISVGNISKTINSALSIGGDAFNGNESEPLLFTNFDGATTRIINRNGELEATDDNGNTTTLT
jgi:hypothetical protein